jgi:hypothetical protein
MEMKHIEKEFERLGARVALIPLAPEPPAVSARRRWIGGAPVPSPVRIVKRAHPEGAVFEVRFRPDQVELSVLSVRPESGRLMLQARRLDGSARSRFLCGIDGDEAFVEAMPVEPAAGVPVVL